MADVKWIKITTDIFDDEKILMIESMPSADSIIVIWLKLLTFAGKQNNDGVFLMSGRIAFTDEMLACIFRRDVNLVRLALKTFEQFGMVEIIENVITIPNWNKHQALDSYEKKKERDRLYMRERRAAQRALITQSSDMSSNKSSDSKTTQSSDVVISERDIEREIESDIDIKEVQKETVPCQAVVDLYHSICVSFPSVRSLSDARKKAIKARLKTYTLDDFKEAFNKAESSDFLKGSNNRNWSANFDWLIKDANMAKVLDGNYDNRKAQTPNGRTEIVPDWMDESKRLDQARKFRDSLRENPELQDRVDKLKERLGGD